MSRPHLPPSRVDSATLPPLLSTGDRGSFAESTFKVRDPALLRDLAAADWFSPDLKRGLEKFRAEVVEGAIQPLREDAPDAAFWRAASKAYVGRSWLDVPWYWAECFFYRRILEIVGYFQMGAWHERDPFGPIKAAELEPHAAPRRVAALLESVPASPERQGQAKDSSHKESFEHLLYSALWGNRVDLSYNVELKVGRAPSLQAERANLIVDDAERVWDYMRTHDLKHLIYVADNAGTELAHDLALIDWLLGAQRVATVSLHLKPQPFYVSDAMPQDVAQTLDALARANEATRALAERLHAQLEAKRLQLRVHWFYPTPLHYFEMPDDLFDLFRAADFVILKGDVNYRRLVGDAHWKPTIAFEYPTRYFPAPLVSLRTLKSDVIVGLRAGFAEELSKEDRAWRVNGKRGVAQANLK